MALSRFIAIFSSSPQQLFEIAPLLAPHIEVCPPDGILLEFPVRYEQDTLNRISANVGRGAQIGGASTRTAAILAAKARPGTIIPPGKEDEFLDSLPIQTLTLIVEIETSILDTFLRWGIQTLGELTSLPKKELVARMGQSGLLLQRIARGEETCLFAGYHPPQHFEKSLDLDWNLDSLEPLSFVLGSLLEALCEQLKSSALSAETIHTSLKLEDGSVHERSLQLAIPMNNPRVLLSLLRLDLQEHPPHQSICAVTVRADPTHTRVTQYSLLQPTNINPEKLSRTLARLKVLVGEENIGYPILLDTHRPDAVKLGLLPLKHAHSRQNVDRNETQVGQLRPQLQLSLRRIRPPEPIQITSQQLLYCAGPWRSCGDWWVENNAHGWSRDEWDIETNEGEIYRIFWDHGKKNWFVEGIYD